MQDCVIVGGGLIGMLTARELAQAGLSVTLLEKGKLGQESSWAGGGIISPLYPWRYADAVTRLAGWSQAHYSQLAEAIREESGIDPQWTKSGLLVLDCEEIELATQWASTHDNQLEQVTAPQTHEIEPALNPGSTSQGLWLADIAQIRNPRLVQAMRGSLQHLGVTMMEQTPVGGLDIRDGQVNGVNYAGGTIKAGSVVIASGAWAGRFLSELGLDIAIEPVRGQMLLYKARPGLVSRIVLSRDRYVIPRRDGRVLVGSTLEYTGFEKVTTQDARQELEAEALRLIPALADYPIEHHWAGLRPGSPDGIPYICESDKIRGLYINAGHFRNGVVLGPASARLLADKILRKSPILDLNPYNQCV